MIGDLAAITCATFFALCSIAFAKAGRLVGSMTVNQVRIVLAVVFLLGAHLAVCGELWPWSMTREQVWLLVLSGVVGLALGDLCYFHALTVLGPKLGTLLMATFPLFVVLGEGLTRRHWPDWLDGLWMAAIVIGVMVVLTGRQSGGWQRPGANLVLAVVAGLLGAVGQGSGIVIAKLADDAAAPGTDPVSVTLVRLVAGCAAMAAISGIGRSLEPGTRRRQPITRRAFYLILTGVMFGPTLGVWLSMVAIDRIDAGRAAVLIALTPVLMLPIAWIGWGERPTARGLLGTLAAFAGTAGLLAGRGA